jgi:hypothetical protein
MNKEPPRHSSHPADEAPQWTTKITRQARNLLRCGPERPSWSEKAILKTTFTPRKIRLNPT